MKSRKITFIILSLCLAAPASSFARAQPSTPGSADGGPYHVSQTFHVGGEGGWDYLTVDPDHKLLYVPRSTHTLVLDAATGKNVGDIPGQKRNQDNDRAICRPRIHHGWRRRLGHRVRFEELFGARQSENG